MRIYFSIFVQLSMKTEPFLIELVCPNSNSAIAFGPFLAFARPCFVWPVPLCLLT